MVIKFRQVAPAFKIAKQHAHLVRILEGHYGYFGITGNASALSRYLYEVTHVWQKWLNRRTGRGAMPWPRFMRLRKRYPLPPPEVVTASTGRSEPVDEEPDA